MQLRSISQTISKKAAAIATAFVLVAGLGGLALAVSVPSGNLGGFELDGNFVVDGGSNLDWTNVMPVIATDDTLDSGFQGSSKEEDPADWTCNTGGANPGKGNILMGYVSPRVEASTAFLDLGFIRQEGGGDAHVNFEFNKNPSPAGSNSGPCPIDRQPGDFLVTYDFAGGSAPGNVRVWRWDGVHWIELLISASDAKAATNASTVTDPTSGASIGVREFGEATLDLLSSAIPNGFVGCPGFGYANIRSRSSESITSALQDRLPTIPVNLNTCGKIIVHKVDDHDPARPLAGAVFGLYKNAGATGTPVQQQASLADGSATFDDLEPGDYWVKELSAPAGYSVDPDIVGPLTVGFKQTVNVSAPFVNPRDVGDLRIVKKLADETGAPVTPDDAGDLDGAAFVVFKDGNGNGTYQAGEEAKLWPAETDVAECTVSNGDGHCDVGPLPIGTYGVHETAAPNGTTPGAAVFPVVVTKNTTVEVDYVNSLSPLNITIDKSGPERAHVGDEITYTFNVTTSGPKLHDVVVEELTTDRCDGAIAGPATTGNGNAFLEVGETWTYSCTHVVKASDPDPLPNEAKVTGTDDFGREVSDTDTHIVDIIKPSITLDKKVENDDHKPIGNAHVAHVGDLLDYTVAISNNGDTALTLSALSDTLKASLPSSCTAGLGSSLAIGATITCAYTSTAAADAHNVAAVTGVDVLGGPAGTVSASDETFVDVIHPAIEVVKDGPGQVHAGDTATFTFKVTNTGDVPLSDVDVTDNEFGAIGTIASLAVGASETISKDFEVPAGPSGPNCPDGHYNLATASGEDALGLVVSDTDDHCADLADPAIEVVKDGPAKVHPGDTATFTFKVTNTGDVDLTDVEVTDNEFGAVGTIASLAVGASQTITKDFVVPGPAAGPNCDDGHRNVATASGRDPLGKTVSDTDDHCTELAHPSIEVVKDGPGRTHAGDTATFTFKVTNTGDVDLTDVEVTDNEFGAIGTIASLAVGASETISKDFVVPGPAAGPNCPDGHYNVATASGEDSLGKSVSDTDDHCTKLADPKVEVVKNGPGQVHEGDTATFTFKVTNVGDIDLTNVVVTDSAFGSIGTIATLDVGSSETISKDFVVPGLASAVNCETGHYNVATVVGTDTLGKDVTDTDDHCTELAHPNIEVVKSGPGQVHAGDTATFTFKVTNTGDVALTNVSVVDNEFGAIGTIASLAVGASETISKDFEVPGVVAGANCPDGHYNVATASGTDSLGKTVSDTDDHCAKLADPAIEVIKDGPGMAHDGDTVEFTFEVTNVGDVDLADVQVTDDQFGPVGTIGSLVVGESKTITKDFMIPGVAAGTNCETGHRNVATAVGTDPLGKSVLDTDDHCVEIADPDIEVVKDGPAAVHAGETATYTFKVTNTGDVVLTDVEVVDDQFGAVGTIATLAVGESKTITKDFVVPGAAGSSDDCEDGHHNVATATGTDPLGLEVSDTDDHCTDLPDPAIEVVKDGEALAHTGDTVTYTFKVTNIGGVKLVDVAVTDDVLGAIGTIDELDAGASETLSKDFVVPDDTDSVANIATACGTDPIDFEVCDEDPHNLLVIDPSIEIVKTATPVSVEPGDEVTYTYDVTNLGDTELTNVLVTDDKLGDIGTIETLAPGETKTLSRTVEIEADSPRTNIGTACGVDALDLEVCDTDDATISIVLPLGPEPRLPATGFRMLLWIAFGTLLVAAGLTMLQSRRVRS